MWPGPIIWLKDNRHEIEGLTGQDLCTLVAIAALWDLYAVSDAPSRGFVICAVAQAAWCVQRKYVPLARELIARSLDWGDREPTWRRVLAEGAPSDV